MKLFLLDLYQEIRYQVWKSLDRFNGRSAPATWAYRIAVNTGASHRRNNSYRDQARRAYGQSVPCKQSCGRGEEQILREFAQSLPGMERKLFTLYLTDLSYKEIAEAAGISEGTLRVKIKRLKHQYEQRYL